MTTVTDGRLSPSSLIETSNLIVFHLVRKRVLDGPRRSEDIDSADAEENAGLTWGLTMTGAHRPGQTLRHVCMAATMLVIFRVLLSLEVLFRSRDNISCKKTIRCLTRSKGFPNKVGLC